MQATGALGGFDQDRVQILACHGEQAAANGRQRGWHGLVEKALPTGWEPAREHKVITGRQVLLREVEGDGLAESEAPS
jgi:hypothetical protein